MRAGLCRWGGWVGGGSNVRSHYATDKIKNPSLTAESLKIWAVKPRMAQWDVLDLIPLGLSNQPIFRIQGAGQLILAAH